MTRVCVGAVVGAHGVRGAVRLKSFTAEPADIGCYGPVQDEATGKGYGLKVIGQAKGLVIARLTGVEDRNAAEALKGMRLTVPRESLPATEEDEFLYADLVGMRAETPDGAALGIVRGLFDFGAGEVLDVTGPKGSLMVPFTRAAVPLVDVAGKRLVVDPPAYAEDEVEEDQGGEG